MSALEEASKAVEGLAPKLESWEKFDQFLLAFLDSVIERMDRTNTGLVERIQAALKAKYDLETLADTISDAVRSTVITKSSDNLHKIEEIMNSQGLVSKDLKALLGIIHYNILLQKRLLAFREIFNTVKKINLSQNNPVEAKKMLLNYGPSLGLIWEHAILFCKSAYEKELFERVVNGKSGFESDRNAA